MQLRIVRNMKQLVGLKCGVLWFVVLASLFFCEAQGAVRYYDFVLKETNFTKLCSTKSILTVNDSFPGPEIHVHRGDTVFITIYNQGTYGVTIHWHGVKMPRNPWSDGPENITQCPIPAGTNFTQEINFSTEEGTLWWHAHSDWSRATVHGAIRVFPANGTSFPYSKPHAEKTIVLASWYKADIMEIYQGPLADGGDFNVSDAYTINGEPGDLYECSNETTYRLTVDYGKTYLLRIVNAVLNEEMFFSIAGHNLTVVGSDGAYIKPVITDVIMITPGQTMDVLLTANQTASYYYMVATPYEDTLAPFDNSTTTAIVQYSGNYTAPSTIAYPSLPLYNDTDYATNFTRRLKSLASAEHPISVPKNITRNIYMTVNVNQLPCPENVTCAGTFGQRQSASLNNVSFYTPSIDILQAYYWNKTQYHDVFSTDFPHDPPTYFNFTGNVSDITVFTKPGTKVILLDYGEQVEMVFQGTNLMTPENHPMHLHGFSFYLVGFDSGNFNNETDPQSYNLDDPPEVNTIGLPKNGWAAIRFTADNPGVWFMHCHLERHTSWGMDTVVIVRDGGTNETSMRPPPPYMPPCSKSY